MDSASHAIACLADRPVLVAVVMLTMLWVVLQALNSSRGEPVGKLSSDIDAQSALTAARERQQQQLEAAIAARSATSADQLVNKEKDRSRTSSNKGESGGFPLDGHSSNSSSGKLFRRKGG
mmetsp:Transcript_12615/g.27240  ORF Transcript_12615/g.27240 Transcript_12615/m.27240 type:complete len:121 (-) Transcript_12615:416-778(-)